MRIFIERRALAGAPLVLCLFLLAGGAALAQGRLSFEPASGPVGTRVQARATGLEPGAEVDLIWSSADASWNVGVGTFHGVLAEETRTSLATATADASGEATLSFEVPEDYGYVHNTHLMRGEEQVARQGFVVVPEITLSPTSGPVGTPIHVRITGIGYRFWEMVWHLLYDGAHTGWASAITTHGTAEFTVPATGGVGPHTLQIMSGAHPVPYLNQQQSPNYKPQVPTVLGATFEITEGDAVLPPAAAEQTLPRTAGDEPAGPADGPTLVLEHASGTVGSAIGVTGSGFAPDVEVVLGWTSVVGNRIDGGGWQEAERELVTVRSGEDGRFRYTFDTPDDLGGEHRIVARSANGSAEATYTITPSVAEVFPRTVAPGGDITLTLKGVGWTETANIYTLVMDNGYLGYGCGFNSQGDVTIHLKAPGTPGHHFIGIHPSIYQGELAGPGAPGPDSTANATYLQLPMLNTADHPGEELPSFLVSFEVRE